VAGTGGPGFTSLRGFTGDGGPATSAELNEPNGVAVDAMGNLLIGDTGNYRIRKITRDGVISTIAGNGQPGFSGDGGPATQAQFNGLLRLAVDAAGDIFVADTVNNRIREVTPD